MYGVHVYPVCFDVDWPRPNPTSSTGNSVRVQLPQATPGYNYQIIRQFPDGRVQVIGTYSSSDPRQQTLSVTPGELYRFGLRSVSTSDSTSFSRALSFIQVTTGPYHPILCCCIAFVSFKASPVFSFHCVTMVFHYTPWQYSKSWLSKVGKNNPLKLNMHLLMLSYDILSAFGVLVINRTHVICQCRSRTHMAVACHGRCLPSVELMGIPDVYR